ncbi:MAG: DUF4339 domain-containing protein [Planctomycetota bacterium]
MSRRRRSSARRRTRQASSEQSRTASPDPATNGDQPKATDSSSTAAQWEIAIDGKPSEPLTAVELKRMVEAGEITPETPIRKVGMEKFVLARKVKGLLAAQAPADLPPPEPAPTSIDTAPADPATTPPAEVLPAPIESAAEHAGESRQGEPSTPVAVDVWDTLDTEELPDIRGS